MAQVGRDNSARNETMASVKPGNVSNLGGAIRQLEEQLDRMVASNEALTQDLEVERKRRLDLEGQVEELREKLRQVQRKDANTDNLRGEVNQLNHERTRLAASVRQLTQRVSNEEQERKRQARLVPQLRVARDDAVEEILAVEAQFDRAMQVVVHLKAQLQATLDERTTLASRLRGLETQQGELRKERDALLADVEQSKAALDEIRRSLVDAFEGSPDAMPRMGPDGGRHGRGE